jgi:hypothetical protein
VKHITSTTHQYAHTTGLNFWTIRSRNNALCSRFDLASPSAGGGCPGTKDCHLTAMDRAHATGEKPPRPTLSWYDQETDTDHSRMPSRTSIKETALPSLLVAESPTSRPTRASTWRQMQRLRACYSIPAILIFASSIPSSMSDTA